MINAAVELTNNAEHYPGLCAMSHTYLRMPGPQFRQGDGGLRLEGGPLNKLWLLVIILHVQALAEQFCMKLQQDGLTVSIALCLVFWFFSADSLSQSF